MLLKHFPLLACVAYYWVEGNSYDLVFYLLLFHFFRIFPTLSEGGRLLRSQSKRGSTFKLSAISLLLPQILFVALCFHPRLFENSEHALMFSICGMASAYANLMVGFYQSQKATSHVQEFSNLLSMGICVLLPLLLILKSDINVSLIVSVLLFIVTIIWSKILSQHINLGLGNIMIFISGATYAFGSFLWLSIDRLIVNQMLPASEKTELYGIISVLSSFIGIGFSYFLINKRQGVNEITDNENALSVSNVLQVGLIATWLINIYIFDSFIVYPLIMNLAAIFIIVENYRIFDKPKSMAFYGIAYTLLSVAILVFSRYSSSIFVLLTIVLFFKLIIPKLVLRLAIENAFTSKLRKA